MSMHEADDAGEDRHARIEQIFQRVEEESERRAQAAEAAEARAVSRLSQAAPDDSVSHTSSTLVTPVAATSARPIVGERRRGSVSVSRFGQAPVASGSGDASRAEMPTAAAAYVANKGSFYAVQNHDHGSADSLASTAEANPASADGPSPAAHEEESVVQMATISGRQSLSRAFSQRLSRSKTPSRVGLDGMLIGVSVEEATIEHHSDDEGDAQDGGAGAGAVSSASPSQRPDAQERRAGRARAASRSIVYAGNGPPPGSPMASRPGTSSGPAAGELKAKGSRASMPSEGAEGKAERTWFLRAKNFTRKLKRRSMIALGAAR
ncbi:hypothetical protein DAEQUDRAFT_723131 [Daedalea quercina L-15889]|uniref:Uncharacterized protein n=1 Tax=Daedalea quercina L-15889 TaxID=1314783 RepID=A0A165SSB9_9APHY|nr:hypothetical protein DAEQUDRAFT_723131 [Daedalea quercina L-15889]